MTCLRVASKSLLVAGLLANAALLAARMRSTDLLHDLRSPLRAGEATIALPSGFGLDGRAYTAPQAPCALLQYRGSHCRYCVDEATVAAALANQLGSMGCSLLVLSPAPAETPLLPPRPARTELVFVSPQWLASLPYLQPEPATLAMGPGGVVVWYYVGELTPAAVEKAVRAVSSALAEH